MLLTASSIVAIVSGMIDVPGASDVAPTGEEVHVYEVAPADNQRQFVSIDAAPQPDLPHAGYPGAHHHLEETRRASTRSSDTCSRHDDSPPVPRHPDWPSSAWGSSRTSRRTAWC